MSAGSDAREALHVLIEKLSPAEVRAVLSFADWLHRRLAPELLKEVEQARQQLDADPVLRALVTAPLDDEPLTGEDIAAIEEGREAYRHGEYVTLDDFLRA